MATKYSDSDEKQHNQRFSDIAGESCQILTPIQGYERQPLVPLEEAIEPILSFVPDVKRMAFIAKQKCKKSPSNSLSIDESASIVLYSLDWEPQEECLYHVLNKTLRSKNRKQLIPWFLYLKLILTALFRIPSSQRVVFRGIKCDIRKDYPEGETIYWWGFSSCTATMKVLENEQFLGSSGARTMFTIECFSGKDIQQHSDFQNEDEILLLPGRQFEVVSCLKQGKDLYLIHLRETKPDYPLLGSGSNDNNHQTQPILESFSRMTVNPNSLQWKTDDDSLQNSNKSKYEEPIDSISSESFYYINSNTTWKQHGITIAGENQYGNRLNQLCWPQGIYIDDDNQCIYIADCGNDRIVKWKYDAKNGEVVAGRNGQGKRMDQLNHPADVIVDKKNDDLIICDRGNKRVIRWSLQNNKHQHIIISDIDCWGLTMDNDGDLYVSDCVKHEVRRWKIGDKSGTIVAGGNGEGNKLNQLNFPTYIFVDQDYSVYVSDYFNHRVMKWMKGAKEGIVVAGGQGQGNSLAQLCCPMGVIVDHLGNVYVADCDNHRIMRWLKGSKEGSIIVGGNGKGKQSNQFCYLRGLSFDRQGNLYVVDMENNRVQKFEINRNNKLNK